MSSALWFTIPALFSLAGCATDGDRAAGGGTCPVGETCTPAAPNGLEFNGVKQFDLPVAGGPLYTAVGGTQDIALEYDPSGGFIPFDLPYVADDTGGAGVAVETTAGPVVTVRGVGAHANYLRITDPAGALYDRKSLVGKDLAHVTLLPSGGERVAADVPLAIATSARLLGIALTDDTTDRLADTSAVLAMTGATQTAWDTASLAGLTAGTFPLTVTAGATTTTLDILVVDHVDAITALAPVALPVGEADLACFQATTAGHAVTGLTWSVTSPSGPPVTSSPILPPNCVGVTPTTLGPLTLAATVDGVTASVTFDVVAAARAERVPASRTPPPSAGERAAASVR